MRATRRNMIIVAAATAMVATSTAAWADAPDSAFSIRPLEGASGEAKASEQVLISADMVLKAYPAADPNGRLALRFEFNDEGRRRLADYTAAHVGERIAFVANGEVLSAPKILDPMTGGKAEISGDFSAETLRTLAAAFPDSRWAKLPPR